jgi:16S rRNA (guanine(527)-N(7))-methyltransferase RsmG
VRKDFIQAISDRQSVFGIELHDSAIARLADYYELVLEHNPLLHLVGPCSADEFAIRHILESLTLLAHLPVGAKFADVGAGAGLPSIPCLIVREDLSGVLIESKEKKAKFLTDAIKNHGLMNRAKIINRQFEEADPADCSFITCRALDKFADKLPRLIKWSDKRTKLFFGGPKLGDALNSNGMSFEEKLMPMSEQRYLFVISLQNYVASRPYSRRRR